MYRKVTKRLMDFVLGLAGLVVVFPILILITLLLLYINRGKPFFFQFRPGINGRLFRLIKFKTMNDAKDLNGYLFPDSVRLTYFGKFLRKTSLDELPQMINVIKGDMSLVGPRPLLPEYLPLYNNHQARRHEVRPGITGWAQVNGRNSIQWEEKFNMDVWYVDNISFRLDLKILILTIVRIVKREGINSDNSATMDRFTGNIEKN